MYPTLSTFSFPQTRISNFAPLPHLLPLSIPPHIPPLSPSYLPSPPQTGPSHTSTNPTTAAALSLSTRRALANRPSAANGFTPDSAGVDMIDGVFPAYVGGVGGVGGGERRGSAGGYTATMAGGSSDGGGGTGDHGGHSSSCRSRGHFDVVCDFLRMCGSNGSSASLLAQSHREQSSGKSVVAGARQVCVSMETLTEMTVHADIVRWFRREDGGVKGQGSGQGQGSGEGGSGEGQGSGERATGEGQGSGERATGDGRYRSASVDSGSVGLGYDGLSPTHANASARNPSQRLSLGRGPSSGQGPGLGPGLGLGRRLLPVPLEWVRQCLLLRYETVEGDFPTLTPDQRDVRAQLLAYAQRMAE